MVQGTVLSGAGVGVGASSNATASSGSASSNSRITVTVEGQGITTTVSANGTFELEGLQPGTFTLLFMKDDQLIGTLTLTVTSPTAEVKLVVQVTESGVLLVELKIDDGDNTENSTASCVISGGRVDQAIELEGDFASGNSGAFKMDVGGQRAGDQLVDVDASHANWRCLGQTGPGCESKLQTGTHLHVRGTLTTCSPSEAKVAAAEVKVQKL